MKFICRKYSPLGDYISETTLISWIDSVEDRQLESIEDAQEYCSKYLMSRKDIEKNNYFICYKR